MTLSLTPKQLAALIATAVEASLQIALTAGCSATDAPDVARAAGANAAQQILAFDIDFE